MDFSISVIIPSLHSPVIGAVLDALRRQTARPLEVIVVGQDRHGQVRTDDLVRFIETPQPVSAATARNLGARAARSQLLLFLDADCVAASDLVAEHLIQHAAGHLAVGGAVAPGTRDFWALCDHLTSYTPYLPQAPGGDRRYLLSGNLSISSRLFAQLGGFDESFRGAAGEDVEFGMRLRLAGVALLFHPGAVVWHVSPRQTMRSALSHLENYGAVAARVRRLHAGMLPSSSGYELAVRMPWLLLTLAPLVGLLKVIALVKACPFLLRYWYVFPGMVLQHGAWCWGFGLMLCRQGAARLPAGGLPGGG